MELRSPGETWTASSRNRTVGFLEGRVLSRPVHPVTSIFGGTDLVPSRRNVKDDVPFRPVTLQNITVSSRFVIPFRVGKLLSVFQEKRKLWRASFTNTSESTLCIQRVEISHRGAQASKNDSFENGNFTRSRNTCKLRDLRNIFPSAHHSLSVANAVVVEINGLKSGAILSEFYVPYANRLYTTVFSRVHILY